MDDRMEVIFQDECKGMDPADLPEDINADDDDSAMSSYEDGRMTINETVTKKQSKEEPMQLAKNGRNVRHVKLLIFIVLLMSITGAFAVYFHTKISENNTFEQEFHENAGKVCTMTILLFDKQRTLNL
jgi:hypothetical protein